MVLNIPLPFLSADIISLQEVETEQFYNFFLPELKRDGYEGIFSAKSRAKTMQETERKHVDGCAIFWRTGKFSLLKEHLVEFNQVSCVSSVWLVQKDDFYTQGIKIFRDRLKSMHQVA